MTLTREDVLQMKADAWKRRRTVALHCCPRCGFTPYEGMARYIEIHGDAAQCVTSDCRKRFVWYAGEPTR